MAATDKKTLLVTQLFDHDIVKFGEFTLKSGITSPFYLDIRTVISYPEILRLITELMWDLVKDLEFDRMCGVPYTALPFANIMAIQQNIPLLLKRKEQKKYGTKKLIEGVYEPGMKCLIVEDLVTSGKSVFETVDPLREVGLEITDVVVVVDREQGGRARVESGGCALHTIVTMTEMLEILLATGKLEQTMVDSVTEWIANNQVPLPTEESAAPEVELTFTERAELCTNASAQRLFQIMQDKQTNLCFSADVTSMDRLLELADAVGEHICLLKTHVDILTDYTPEGIQQLQEIATQKDFLIFEDRKFADIGSTMLNQFTKGVYNISNWAHITNAHSIAGDGVFSAFRKAETEAGLLLLAQLSCKGNLITPEYTKKTVTLAEQNKDCTIGFICQEKLSSDPSLIHMTPGVNLKLEGDALGQQYNTPEVVIGQKKSDMIIVGRGIYGAEDPVMSAVEYKTQAWDAYCSRFS